MEEKRTELEYQQRELRLLRAELGLNRKQFALEYGIPLRTVEDWEHGKRKMPEYVLRLLTYKVRLDSLGKGSEEKVKANMVTAVGELIQIATNKMQYPDYGKKHKAKAKYGWYRYDTRFGIPVYDEDDDLMKYNIFSARMLVRCDTDGKSYLYDFIRIKKETRSPLEQ